MQFCSRVMTASHILLYLAEYETEEKITSNVLADTTGVNPVNIRKILAKLKAAGLVEIKSGIGGAYLSKSMEEITLADIYDAVEEKEELFPMHEHPNVHCPVGASIRGVMESRTGYLQNRLHDMMAAMKLSDMYCDMKRKIEETSKTKS